MGNRNLPCYSIVFFGGYSCLIVGYLAVYPTKEDAQKDMEHLIDG